MGEIWCLIFVYVKVVQNIGDTEDDRLWVPQVSNPLKREQHDRARKFAFTFTPIIPLYYFVAFSIPCITVYSYREAF